MKGIVILIVVIMIAVILSILAFCVYYRNKNTGSSPTTSEESSIKPPLNRKEEHLFVEYSKEPYVLRDITPPPRFSIRIPKLIPKHKAQLDELDKQIEKAQKASKEEDSPVAEETLQEERQSFLNDMADGV